MTETPAGHGKNWISPKLPDFSARKRLAGVTQGTPEMVGPIWNASPRVCATCSTFPSGHNKAGKSVRLQGAAGGKQLFHVRCWPCRHTAPIRCSVCGSVVA
ncbi:hypothetical protein [Klebsiella aerogenes]|uniref:hypothetical protein n=1 Tax=Klebsiella aerogenes TaxID=548 RepID=UPI003890BB9A